MTTEDVLAQIAATVLRARQERQRCSSCVAGGQHTWTFRREDGEGWYTCQNCSLRVSKTELKRATDRGTITLSLES